MPRFSQSNEETALNDALDRCKQAVAGFAGSLQSDLGTLADADPGTPRYNLATVRATRRPVPVALAPHRRRPRPRNDRHRPRPRPRARG